MGEYTWARGRRCVQVPVLCKWLCEYACKCACGKACGLASAVGGACQWHVFVLCECSF